MYSLSSHVTATVEDHIFGYTNTKYLTQYSISYPLNQNWKILILNISNWLNISEKLIKIQFHYLIFIVFLQGDAPQKSIDSKLDVVRSLVFRIEKNEKEDKKLSYFNYTLLWILKSQEKLASKTATHLCAAGSISESFNVSKGKPG